jgi:hypothetical protein
VPRGGSARFHTRIDGEQVQGSFQDDSNILGSSVVRVFQHQLPPDNGAKGTGWTSLSAMTGGCGGSNSSAGSTAGIGAGNAAAGALGGGIGVDARGWVKGVLGGLNR